MPTPIPISDPLKALARELLEPHLTEDNEPEDGLLQLLFDAIANSSESGGVGGGSAETKAPLDLGALELWDRISAEIRAFAPELRAFSEADVLRQLVEDFEEVFGQLELMESMLRWRDDIRAHFDPPKIVPLRNVACPMCKAGKTAEGEYPLSLHASATPPSAQCAHCGTRWVGGELLDLRAYLNN